MSDARRQTSDVAVSVRGSGIWHLASGIWRRETWSAGRRLLPAALLVGVAVVVLGPALAPGYVLTLDMVFVPRFHVPWDALTSGQNSRGLTPVYLLLAGATRVLPGDLVQKLVLLAILSGAGLGIVQTVPGPLSARLLAGVFYVVNPFVYERLLAGQWLFLAGYALTPWAFGAMVKDLTPLPPCPPSPQGRGEGGSGLRFRAVLFWSGAALLSVHHAVLLAVPLFGLVVGHLLVGRWAAVWRAATVGALFLLVNGGWLALSLLDNRFAASIDLSHYLAFAARPDQRYGLVPNLLALYGFWREHIEIQLTKEALPLWPLWHAPLWAVMVAGLLLALRVETAAVRERSTGGGSPSQHGRAQSQTRSRTAAVRRHVSPVALGLIVTLVVATFAAMGPSVQTYVVNNWLFEHVAPLRALRDPQKFVALIALAQSWALALGVGALAAWRPRGAVVLSVALGALVLVTNARMLWGLGGQVEPVQYPASWDRAARALEADPQRGKLLVLPWSQYVRFDFTPRIVGNPAPSYFGGSVLVNPDPGLPRVRTAPVTPEARAIEALLRAKDPQWTTTLQALGVTHVLVTRASGTPDYTATLATELERVLGDGEATLYRVP